MSADEHESASVYCLSLKAPFQQTEQFADLLSQISEDIPPAVSMHETDDPAIWGLDAYFEIKPDLGEIKTTLEKANAPLPELTLAQMENKDWVAIVQSGLCPVKAERFFIHGHHDRHLAGPQAGNIEIDAGQAFGTAHHGTTRGCLLALDHLFKTKKGRALANVLDLGTGTGLLAIAVAKISKQKILASDIDPISVNIARENATLNQVGPLLEPLEANGLGHAKLQKKAPYDLVVANILAAPLLAMARDLQKVMRPGGTLILSGLLQTQARTIEARYRSQGFCIKKRFPLDEWITLVLRYR